MLGIIVEGARKKMNEYIIEDCYRLVFTEK